MRQLIDRCLETVLGGGEISREDALSLFEAEGPDLVDLMAAANRIRHHFRGDAIHLCSIVNAKSGSCSEDCGFCSQSAHFDTGIPEYGFIGDDEIVAGARRAIQDGSKALGLVAAWRGLKRGPTLDRVLGAIRHLASQGGILADASLGIIEEPGIAHDLKAAGLHTYNHNLETSRRHFPKVCGTHDYDERVRTLEHLRAAGIRRCSGGIFGMGEAVEDRVDLALELRRLEVEVVPLNFLNPMEGTPLEGQEPISPMEVLKTIAVMRFLLPRQEIMIAGGREVNLRDLQPMMFIAGASATMAGAYLTTGGRKAEDDWRMIRDLGLDPGIPPQAPPARRAPSKAGAPTLPVLSAQDLA
ncbi:biotin synthase BioB [Myxococcota bacterium]|nr:biotin synthase BioB [Myxococcota bacterium]